jgi:hypothetical protein
LFGKHLPGLRNQHQHLRRRSSRGCDVSDFCNSLYHFHWGSTQRSIRFHCSGNSYSSHRRRRDDHASHSRSSQYTGLHNDDPYDPFEYTMYRHANCGGAQWWIFGSTFQQQRELDRARKCNCRRRTDIGGLHGDRGAGKCHPECYCDGEHRWSHQDCNHQLGGPCSTRQLELFTRYRERSWNLQLYCHADRCGSCKRFHRYSVQQQRQHHRSGERERGLGSDQRSFHRHGGECEFQPNGSAYSIPERRFSNLHAYR